VLLSQACISRHGYLTGVHLLGVRLLQARISLASLEHASLQGYFSHCEHLLGVVSYGDASLKHASLGVHLSGVHLLDVASLCIS
jgi:hypothetical protein